MKEFKVNDKVKTIAQGYGVILNTESGITTYPITVAFKKQNVLFTEAGFNHVKDLYRSLYHADEQFIDPPKPMKKVKVGGKVAIYRRGDEFFYNPHVVNSQYVTTVYLETEIEVEE